jgi:hypothetical protein
MKYSRDALTRRRNRPLLPAAAAVLAALLVAACSDSPAPRARPAAGETSSPQVARIVFDLPGDDIGGPEAQALLADVEAAIRARQAGEILRSGHGMGETEIVVRYQGEDALERIKQAIDAARPGTKYRIVREAL